MSKTTQKLLSIIPQCSRDPFYILEGKGKILFSNKQGLDLLNISEASGNLVDNFVPDTKEKFDGLFDKVVEQDNTLTVEHFEFELNSGRKIKGKLMLNSFINGTHLYVFCTIVPISSIVAFSKKINFRIRDINSKKIIKNEKIIEILKKVEALFPLTFIGKEIIYKLVNALEESFWLIDTQGKFILVNDYFSERMGLKPFQMEGKAVDDFVPGYLREMNSMIDKFIKDTMNCVVLEGLPFREIESLEGKEIVLLPLFDEENNIQAIIGISQIKEADYRAKPIEELFDVLYKIIDYFPKPVAFITSEGTIKHSSEEFCKLFDRKSGDL